MVVKLRAKHFINKSQVEKITHGLDKSQAKINQLCVFNSCPVLKKRYFMHYIFSFLVKIRM